MEIRGTVHCLFEQSGTFKNEFIKLGYPAKDYDIQNNFGETDEVIDIFGEITKAYLVGGNSLFDKFTSDDLVLAFFPCIYFSAMSQMAFSFGYTNYRCLTMKEKADKILERSAHREEFYRLLIMMVTVAYVRGIRMIIENPWNEQTYLKANFVMPPTIVDTNRMKRGDYYVKPTAYFFINCEPTYGRSMQNDKEKKTILTSKMASRAGLCSEERSMISPDYARNFICDFILGKKQNITEPTLFD